MDAMPTLDIDMGNTRTKWRCGGEGGALPAPELPCPVVAPERVRVASVLGNRGSIAAEIRRRFNVEAEFAATSASLAGVRCGYREPHRLGVDRWLAVVAAWQRTHHALAVISVGTAACADFVDADGRHAGGYIAPGLRLLVDVLDRRTAGVRPEPREEPSAGECEGPAPRKEEPSAGEREGPAPRKEEPSAGEREGPAPRKEEPSAGEREGPAPRKEEPSAGEREGLAPRKEEPSAGEREEPAPRNQQRRLEPGTDTQQAVAAGTLMMLTAFVDAALVRLRSRSSPPVAVFLTGGDAALLAPRLGVDVRWEPELVLDGLTIALP